MKSRATLPVAVLVSFAAGLLYAWVLQARVTTQTVQMVMAKMAPMERPKRAPKRKRSENPESTETRTLMEIVEQDGELHWEAGDAAPI